MWNPFKGHQTTRATPGDSSVGMTEEHLALRRAIERCDALKPAYDAGQYSVADLVETLKRNEFTMAIIQQAIEESWGTEAAKGIR